VKGWADTVCGSVLRCSARLLLLLLAFALRAESIDGYTLHNAIMLLPIIFQSFSIMEVLNGNTEKLTTRSGEEGRNEGGKENRGRAAAS
jgi:ABC-type uncharacterized transport system permease subunit